MTNRAIERRFLALDGLEMRAAEGKAPELVGYASVFNQPTTIAGMWDQWQEEVAPGAFSKTIAEADIRALFNHDSNIVLGRNKAGTLWLSEDAHGLQATIKPPDNEWGRPVLDAVKRGDITGMSISFQAIKQEWYRPEKGSGELPKRTIREAKLYDVSPVTYPAFEATSIAARAAGVEPGMDDAGALVEAWRLMSCFRAGMALTAEDRQTILQAADMLRSCLPSGEPVIDHSLAARAGEPDLLHSAEARARMLDLLRFEL